MDAATRNDRMFFAMVEVRSSEKDMQEAQRNHEQAANQFLRSLSSPNPAVKLEARNTMKSAALHSSFTVGMNSMAKRKLARASIVEVFH